MEKGYEKGEAVSELNKMSYDSQRASKKSLKIWHNKKKMDELSNTSRLYFLEIIGYGIKISIQCMNTILRVIGQGGRSF